MKKFVLMVAMVVSCVCMAQNSHAQTGRDGNTDIDMLSMKNFYAIDIVDVVWGLKRSDKIEIG